MVIYIIEPILYSSLFSNLSSRSDMDSAETGIIKFKKKILSKNHKKTNLILVFFIYKILSPPGIFKIQSSLLNYIFF